MKTEQPRLLGRVGRRAVITAAVGLVVVVAVTTRQRSLPDFEATGRPVALPDPGAVPLVSLSTFKGLIVGQQGRPVVVNIWASWCAPCRTEMPLLQRAADAYTGRAVILGVASNDDPDAARLFLKEFGLTYPNVFDQTGDIRVALGLTAYPTTYVFGVDGRLRARVAGGVSEQRLTALIEDALA